MNSSESFSNNPDFLTFAGYHQNPTDSYGQVAPLNMIPFFTRAISGAIELTVFTDKILLVRKLYISNNVLILEMFKNVFQSY